MTDSFGVSTEVAKGDLTVANHVWASGVVCLTTADGCELSLFKTLETGLSFSLALSEGSQPQIKIVSQDLTLGFRVYEEI